MNDQTDSINDIRLMSEELSKKVKEVLAEYLGTESEDISDDDSFIDNLNMTPSDIFDFFNSLNEKGVETSNVKIDEIETVGDLIEILSAEESL